MIAFLLDQAVPRSAVDHLRGAGCDAVHTSSTGLASADDEAILEEARRHSRVMVKLDADFHALLALSAAPQTSSIRSCDVDALANLGDLRRSPRGEEHHRPGSTNAPLLRLRQRGTAAPGAGPWLMPISFTVLALAQRPSSSGADAQGVYAVD